jgi:cell division septation protein DedD
VQLGAFGEEERARAVVQQAVAAGFEARLVRVDGSPLLHVRVGSFAERPGAQALFERLAREGIQGAVVRDDRPERPAGS